MTMATAIDTILTRRSASTRFLAEPVPDAAQLDLIVRAAATAPDHKRLRPYRFILIAQSRRGDLAKAFREAKLDRNPDATPDDLSRAADKALKGPMLIAIVLKIIRDHPRVSVTDQMLTAGAALENMLLAAAALGFGHCLRSGQSATSRRVREAMDIATDEELAAFLLLGTPTRPALARDDDVSDLLSIWD
ncbi:MAG: nitroreductase [Hyphomicrobiaceae bacterium]|nr:nitroreductase [Hyphomicrobiaceae bacterium]